jgi:diaminopimelate decarboxylase
MFDDNIIKKFETIETPFYYYNLELLRDTVDRITNDAKKFDFHLHYALKANSNPRILDIISATEMGADCVSGGEIQRAIECNFAPEKIVYAGVGKADWEIELALKNDIQCFNCESIPEIKVIDEIAGKMNKTARIALRINPNVNASTHEYITTGLEENKFGINRNDLYSVIEMVRGLKNTQLIGLHFHIGSQITKMEAFKSLCLRVNEIQTELENADIFLEHINLGGGLGVDYENPEFLAIPDFYSYFNVFHKFLEIRHNQQIHFEPGRAIVANCGSLITKVLYVKQGINTDFAIVDAGMTELIRPALYQAFHKIENLSAEGDEAKYDVVGPICESSDCFGKAISLPEIKRNDLLAIRSTGAYGEAMQSDYNLRRRAIAIFSE